MPDHTPGYDDHHDAEAERPEPLIVSYSEIDTYRQCPLKHKLGYQLRYRDPAPRKGAAHKGTWWHTALETHYGVIQELQGYMPSPQRGTNREAAWLAACLTGVQKALLPLVASDEIELLSDLMWMYDGYVKVHGCDPGWRIEAVEAKKELYLGTIVTGGDEIVPVHLKTRADLIAVDEQGGRWIWDHKSCANLSKVAAVDLDDQFGLYQWAWQASGKEVMGSLRNETRTTRNKADQPGYVGPYKPQQPDEMNQRIRMDRSAQELQIIMQDALAVVQAAYGGGPIYSSPNIQTCGWKCDYEDVHMLMRKGKSIKDATAAFGFVQDFTRH